MFFERDNLFSTAGDFAAVSGNYNFKYSILAILFGHQDYHDLTFNHAQSFLTSCADSTSYSNSNFTTPPWQTQYLLHRKDSQLGQKLGLGLGLHLVSCSFSLL
jgi:hypothetical protein